MLRDTAYGKSRVRLVQLTRRNDRHELCDLTIAIRFQGSYDESYTAGDNSAVLPTDTMKNTVYALAATERVRDAESFGLVLARHFLDRNPRLERVRIDITEHAWGRIASGDREYGQAFVRQGPDTRTSTIDADRHLMTVDAGVADLVILKSSHSAFAGFPRDEYTTLPETHDRIFATSLTATWRYRDTRRELRHRLAGGSQDAPGVVRGASQRLRAAHAPCDGAGGDRERRRRHVDSSRHAQQTSPAGRSRAPRAREPQRDLRADR